MTPAPSAPPDAPPPRPLAAPTSDVPRPIGRERVGPYRLHYELASGGMARVCLASRVDGRGDVVALKQIHPHLVRERSFFEMFVDEASLATRLLHPNVCRVLDVGEDDGVPYLAMEFLRGQPLSRVERFLNRVKRSPRERIAFALGLSVDAARGLHAAHEAVDQHGRPLRVVHRDVSPHNLFLTYEGRCKVLDFGVATFAHRLHRTQAGVIKGKLGYMAPEQMQGKALDRRADVFSLGVVLWELLAGRHLFRRASQADTVAALWRAERPALVGMVPVVDDGLEAILDRALAREPAGRHQTAAELADELEGWLTRHSLRADERLVASWLRELFAGQREELDALIDRTVTPPDGIAGDRSRIQRRPSSVPPVRKAKLPLHLVLLSVVALLLGAALAGGAQLLFGG